MIDEPEAMAWLVRDMERLRSNQCTILSAEIGSSLVYKGDRDADFESMIRRHLGRQI